MKNLRFDILKEKKLFVLFMPVFLFTNICMGILKICPMKVICKNQFFFTKELQSVHSGIVGFDS